MEYIIEDIVMNGPKVLDNYAKEFHPFTQRGKITKSPHLFCTQCIAVPYDYNLDENGIVQGKLFATIKDLRNHYIFYHGFEFSNTDPELHQDFNEALTWSFGICEQCDALCLTEESLNFHKKTSHNSSNVKKVYQYFQTALDSNDACLDKRVQHRYFVESLMKSHNESQQAKKPNSWQTEGDPDAYDLDKVLRELNEVMIYSDVV